MPSKTSAQHSLYLVAGSDEAAVKKSAQALAEKLAPSDPMNLETVNGRAESVDEALKAIEELRISLQTLPFFGGGKLVWWKNVNFLDDSVIGRSAAVKEALDSLVPDLLKADGHSLTVIVSAVAFHKGRAFPKALMGMGKAEFHDLPDLRREGIEPVLDRIESRLARSGLKPEPGVAERLFQAVGIDSALLEAEIAKLECYVGPSGGALTLDTVCQLASGKVDAVIWDFCDAVLRRKSKDAFALLDQLVRQEESEVGIAIVLAGQVRLAALAAALMENGLMRVGGWKAELSPKAEDLLPRKKSGEAISSYNLGMVAQKIGKTPARHWFRAVDTLHHALRQMLSGQGDKARLLELAVLEIVG
jgi:DNA polymerase-3 subunit delta